MPPLGTAPRRVSSGVWVTRTGRPLTAAGAQYWENLFRQRRTTGTGRMTPAPIPTRAAAQELEVRRAAQQAATEKQIRARRNLQQMGLEPKPGPFRAKAAGPFVGPQADPFGLARQAARQRAAIAVAKPAPSSFGGITRLGRGIAGGAEHLAARAAGGVLGAAWQQDGGRPTGFAPRVPALASPQARALALTGKTIAGGTRKASEWTVGPSLTAAITGRPSSRLGLGVDIAMLPFLGLGPIKGARAAIAGGRAVAAREGMTAAARAVEEAYHGPGLAARAARTLQAGVREQQIHTARSGIARTFFERPMDIFSRRYPELPVAGERARVMKAGGREHALESGRERIAMEKHIRVLPDEDSPEDVAHFWWSQLPEEHRNAGGLRAVRDWQAAELDRILNRGTAPQVRVGKAAAASIAQKQGRVARLQKLYDRASARAAQPEITRLHEFGGEGLVEAGPRRTEPTRGVFTRTESPTVQRIGGALSVAKDDLAAAVERAGRPKPISKGELKRLPEKARSTAHSVAQLNQLIANTPEYKPEIVDAIHGLSGTRQDILQTATKRNLRTGEITPLLDPARAEQRKGLLANALGIEPTGEEAFIGHRPGEIRGRFGLRSPGTGKPQYPSGLTSENKLVLAKTGAVHQSTHVAAKDWQAAQTYKDAMRARDFLGQVGKPYEGHLPERHMLVNPEGEVVPPDYTTDKLARLEAVGTDVEQFQAEAEKVMRGFVGDKHNWEDVLQAAKAAGVPESKLRVVPERDVERFYNQFLPAGPRTKGARLYDHLIDATAASLIFSRIGYIPKNVLQNLILALPHQGPLMAMNIPRAAGLAAAAHRPGASEADQELWRHLAYEVGGGPSGAIGKEATTQLIGKPAQWATNIADSPLRISAFLHEAAAEGVIPRFGVKLTEKDKRGLLDLVTNPDRRAELNDISNRAVQAMGDFNRLTPQQRRWARRFLIVPGWLAAGTRYPIHFAATHPIRSGALAYAAAGEPGAPKQLQVNKPISDYFVKDVPSWFTGLSAEHWPGWLGGGKGRVFRTSSLLPGSLPFDVGIAAARGDPWSAANYVNPFPESAYNLAKGVYETPAGETRKTGSWQQNIEENIGQRLVPWYGATRHLIEPGWRPSKLYPEHGRRQILEREVGTWPVGIDRDAALRQKLAERGADNAVQKLDDKTKTIERMKTFGLEPTQEFNDVYDRQVRRMERTTGLKRRYRGLDFQRHALRSDLDYYVQLGLMTKDERDATVKESDQMVATRNKEASQRQIESWRTGMAKAFLDPHNIIGGMKDYLSGRENAQRVPAGQGG